MDKSTLINNLSPILDNKLVESLISEFISMERRYVLCDWEPTTLDGGQFSEIASRIIYHVDSGNLSRRKEVKHCLKYIEDENDQNSHSFPNRRAALHFCKVIRTIYKFRSQRGAIHIDPDYTANELDSTMLMANVRWVFAEMLRILWAGSDADIATAIREIVRFEVPAVLNVDGRNLVLRPDCTVEEEILILLHDAGQSGMSRSQLGDSIPKAASSITIAIQRLSSANKRQIVKRRDGTFLLTPQGTKRVREELAGKLSIS